MWIFIYVDLLMAISIKELKDNVILVDDKGKIIYYGLNKFKSEVVWKWACFICWAHKWTKEFNEEHVIPDRLLSYCKLHNQSVNIPNWWNYNYSKLKISCCKDCNSLLWDTIEIPVSNLLKKDYISFTKEIQSNPENILLIFRRLVLIFFKIHLKDKDMKGKLDSQDWIKLWDKIARDKLHHLHCIARSNYTNAKLNKNILWSICFVPITNDLEKDYFNFADNQISQTIMMKIWEIWIIAVLDDMQSVATVYINSFKKIDCPLTYLQLIELFANFVGLRLCITTTFDFYSNIILWLNWEIKEYTINAKKIKKIKTIDNVNEIAPKISWGILYHYASEIIESSWFDKEIIDGIKSWKRSFLFNNWKFINYWLTEPGFNIK